ncbi:MAG: phage major capsid protein [FCB group bacterium]|nr:phage major capsid protein [FCB group bacterium]
MPDEQVETTEVKALQIDYGLLAAALVDEQEKRQESKPPEAKSAGMITNMETAEDRKVKDGVPLYATIGEFCKAIADNPNDAKLGALRSDEAINEGGFSLAGALGPRKVSSLSAAKAKAISGMSELVPADGGLLVGTDIRPGIMERVYSTGLLLQMLNIMPISNTSNSMTLYGVAETSRADGSRLGGVQAYWAAEGDEKTGSKPKFEEINFKLNKVIGLVYSTDELLQDAGALDSWIMSRLPNELRFKVEDAVIRGTGGGQPLGILSSAALISITKEVGQAADTIVSENIIKQRARRWAGVNDYVYLINQDTEPQLHQLNLPVGTGGALVYMPPGGLSAAPYGSLYGRPVIPTEYNPTVGDVGDLLMISPSQYQMVDKGGIQAAASIHVRFIYDESVFRFVYRVDGKPMWNSELTPYQGTNTQSPFVAIAARA